MPRARATLRRIFGVYGLVSLAVYGVTRLEGAPGFGQYVHLVVAAIFVLSALRLTRHDVGHYGVALGGLLEPPDDDRPAGPLGLLDLGRALIAATPSAITELAVAAGIAAIVFPLYAVGYAIWTEPAGAFDLVFPSHLASYVLAQVIVVALPEEAFFRGYVQTALTDVEHKRIHVFGVAIAPTAWLLQAVLFAALHFIVEPHPARLAVFFPALLFGWLRAWRDGVGAAIALHAMSNLYSEILSRSWL